MSPELIAILVTAGLQTAMLIAAWVMVYRQGKLFEPLDLTDKRIQDAIKKANALMREELLKGAK